MTEGRPGSEPPRSADSLNVNPGASDTDPVSNSPAGRLLRDSLNLMNDPRAEAGERRADALSEMRQRAGDVVVEIAAAEAAADRENYPLRFQLVHTAAELKRPEALPFLRQFVRTRIPPERSSDPHSYSTVAEETILRTTAVEGVEQLAAEGNNEAREALFEFLRQDSLSIRRAAVQALLATGGEGMRRRIQQALPEQQRFLLDIRRVEPDEVPQIEDPQRHLKEQRRPGGTPPAPELPNDRPG